MPTETVLLNHNTYRLRVGAKKIADDIELRGLQRGRNLVLSLYGDADDNWWVSLDTGRHRASCSGDDEGVHKIAPIFFDDLFDEDMAGIHLNSDLQTFIHRARR